MAQQTIYVEGLGFIPIASGQTPQDAIAAAQQGRGSREQSGSLGIGNPMGDESVGFNLPPVAGGDASAILKAFPQLAGLIASFTTQGKSLKMAAGVPSVVDIIMQAAGLTGDGDIDPVHAAGQGAMGVGGKWTGDLIGGISRQGGEKVIKALGLGADATDPQMKMLKKLALEENARLTEGSEAAIRGKGQATAAQGYTQLADAMGVARRADARAPARMTLWPQEAAANYLRRAPRQMAMGQTMAKAGAAAMPAETALRLALAALQARTGAEPPMATSRGTRRRSGQ